MASQTHTQKDRDQDQDKQNPSGYEPTLPKEVDVSRIYAPEISQFITRFFQVSDNPDLTEEWLSFFGDKAKLVMGDKVAKGKEEIRTLRKGMWEKVESRKHTVHKIFPGQFHRPQSHRTTGAVDADEDVFLEFMVYGSVGYTSRETETETGEEEKEKEKVKEERMDWAAHAEFIRRCDAAEQDAGQGAGDGVVDGQAPLTAIGNTSMFVFKKYRVYLSPSVE